MDQNLAMNKVAKRKRGYRKFFTKAPKGACPWKPRPKKKVCPLPLPSNTAGREKPVEKPVMSTEVVSEISKPLSNTEVNEEPGFLGFDEINEDRFLHLVSLDSSSVLSERRVPRKPINGIRVLSLFDGISTGLVVLEKLGLQVEAYYSCEVDESAIAVQRFNWFGKITELGSVTVVSSTVLDSLGRIDLLLGGSPCSEISRVNPRRKGIHDESASGILFYEYSRLLKHLLKKGRNDGTALLWLFENTACMDQHVLNDINKELECQPVMRCASAYVPMKRKRFFWGNIPFLHEKGNTVEETTLKLQDFLKPYRKANVNMLPTLTSTSHSQYCGKEKKFPVVEAGKGVMLHISEIELLFGFPMHYTGGTNLSLSTKRKLLGRAWSVPVIEDILRPLCALYKSSYTISLDW